MCASVLNKHNDRHTQSKMVTVVEHVQTKYTDAHTQLNACFFLIYFFSFTVLSYVQSCYKKSSYCYCDIHISKNGSHGWNHETFEQF